MVVNFFKKYKLWCGLVAIAFVVSTYINGLIVSSLGLLYLAVLFLVPLGVVIGIRTLWMLVFCRGYSTNEGVKFELSTFAEYILYVFNILLAILVSWMLFSGAVEWYDWIFAIMLIWTSVGSCFSIYSNKNDYLVVSKGKVIFHETGSKEEFNFTKYSFSQGESKALVSTIRRGKSQWHLEFESEQGTKISFDLSDMNVGFHKKVIEKCLYSIASSS